MAAVFAVKVDGYEVVDLVMKRDPRDTFRGFQGPKYFVDYLREQGIDARAVATKAKGVSAICVPSAKVSAAKRALETLNYVEPARDDSSDDSDGVECGCSECRRERSGLHSDYDSEDEDS